MSVLEDLLNATTARRPARSLLKQNTANKAKNTGIYRVL
jgi:hypothetical protein